LREFSGGTSYFSDTANNTFKMAWSKATRIKVMLGIDGAFFLLELAVGIAVQSLALMADAFHMLNDIISLVVGLWAVNAAQKSSSDKYSFGVGILHQLFSIN